MQAAVKLKEPPSYAPDPNPPNTPIKLSERICPLQILFKAEYGIDFSQLLTNRNAFIHSFPQINSLPLQSNHSISIRF